MKILRVFWFWILTFGACNLIGLPTLAESPPTLTLGAMFSLSGFGAEVGQGDLNGLLLARDEINAAGGIAGRKVELRIEDFRSETSTAVTTFKKLVSIDKVSAILGPNYTEFTEVVFPIADQMKVPLVATSGYPVQVLGPREGKKFFSFTLWPHTEAALKPLLDRMKAQGYTSVAALCAENAYYESLLKVLTERLSEQGVRVRSFTVAPDLFDLRSVLSNVKATNSQAVAVFLTETGQLAAFFRQARELGLTLPVYGENHILDDVVLAKNRDWAEGATFFQYAIAGTDGFKAKYEKRYGSAPKFTSARAYDALYIMKAAIEKCGEAPEQIRACLAEGEFGGVSGRIKFDSRGALATLEGLTALYKIKAGQVVPVGM